MKQIKLLIFLLSIGLLSSCIKDDFVEDTIQATLRITTNLESIEIESEHQFNALYLNNVGQETDVEIDWSSSDSDIISISKQGLAKAVGLGSAIIKAEYLNGNTLVEDITTVEVGQATIIGSQSISGKIGTTSSYALEGDFVFSETSTGVSVSFSDNYKASSALPGLFVYLSNNKNSIANAFEIGEVKSFTGAHDYDVEGVEFNQFNYLVYFCKPFNVKVGDGKLNF